MDQQFRRGINRPKAQRLSISLAPLVAQRSLLFRVRTDLSQRSSYDEASPESSAGLYTAASSVAVSATSIKSSSSVYSQESYVSPMPSPVMVVKVDRRRLAMAFSPSVQWSNLSEDGSSFSDSDKDSDDSSMVDTPPDSPTSARNVPIQSSEGISVHHLPNNETTIAVNPMHTVDIQYYMQRKAEEDAESNMKLSKSIKRKMSFSTSVTAGSSTPGPSKPTLSRIISHLPLPHPSRKSSVETKRVLSRSGDSKLPDVQLISSPVRSSFSNNPSYTSSKVPSLPRLPVSHLVIPPRPAHRDRATLAVTPDHPPPYEEVEKVTVRRTHTTGSFARPPTPGGPLHKGHRRHASSPGFQRWDAANMPPLPGMAIPSPHLMEKGRRPPTPGRQRARTLQNASLIPSLPGTTPGSF